MESALMSLTIVRDNLNVTVQINRPTICPRCKHAIGEHVLYSVRYVNNKKEYMVAVLFQCDNCFKPFICIYQESTYKQPRVGMPNEVMYRYDLIECGPVGIDTRHFSDKVNKLSERFSDIFNQAYAAEQAGLDEVCGMAYGKALEFIVKDFAISKHPEDQDKIANMLLSTCIKTYIDEDRIKRTAERCVWLRNDQTHYVVKHEDRNLGDLKNLLEATLFWINMALITDDATEIQPKDHV